LREDKTSLLFFKISLDFVATRCYYYLVATKRGDFMKATDKINSNKDYMLRVRMDKNILKKLDDISSDKNKSRSETVRELIENEFEKIKK
jgi:ribbon-helix-helix protein, copG family